jgi:hypothetical protein
VQESQPWAAEEAQLEAATAFPLDEAQPAESVPTAQPDAEPEDEEVQPVQLPPWARKLLDTPEDQVPPDAAPLELNDWDKFMAQLSASQPEASQSGELQSPDLPQSPDVPQASDLPQSLDLPQSVPPAQPITGLPPAPTLADLSSEFFFAEDEPAENAPTENVPPASAQAETAPGELPENGLDEEPVAAQPESAPLDFGLGTWAYGSGPQDLNASSSSSAGPLEGELSYGPTSGPAAGPFTGPVDAGLPPIEDTAPPAQALRPFLFDDLVADGPVIPSPERAREETAPSPPEPVSPLTAGKDEDLVLPWEQEGNLDWLENEADTKPVIVGPHAPASDANVLLGLEASPIDHTHPVAVGSTSAESPFGGESSSGSERPFRFSGGDEAPLFANANVPAFGLEIPSEEAPSGSSQPVSPFYDDTEVAPPPEGSVAYTCILIPRLDHHLLVGNVAQELKESVPQNCLAFGWYLEDVVVQAGYLLWTVQVTPTVSPGNLVRIIRQRTSDQIFEHYPYMHEPGEPDFWAPGSLALRSSEPPSDQIIQDFIDQTRRRQTGADTGSAPSR